MTPIDRGNVEENTAVFVFEWRTIECKKSLGFVENGEGFGGTDEDGEKLGFVIFLFCVDLKIGIGRFAENAFLYGGRTQGRLRIFLKEATRSFIGVMYWARSFARNLETVTSLNSMWRSSSMRRTD